MAAAPLKNSVSGLTVLAQLSSTMLWCSLPLKTLWLSGFLRAAFDIIDAGGGRFAGDFALMFHRALHLGVLLAAPGAWAVSVPQNTLRVFSHQ